MKLQLWPVVYSLGKGSVQFQFAKKVSVFPNHFFHIVVLFFSLFAKLKIDNSSLGKANLVQLSSFPTSLFTCRNLLTNSNNRFRR